jgi:predicted nuclease of predicted toxin-antitoxin system
MKLLFDENLAERLVRDLADLFPGSSHVLLLDLGGARDRAIWDKAAAEDFVIVTRDEDFLRLSVLLGPPPKVIWIRLGNCPTSEVAQLLRVRSDEVQQFALHLEAAFLELG